MVAIVIVEIGIRLIRIFNMNLQTYLHDKAEKNILKYDEVKLKQMTCSHIEQDKFIDNRGNVQMRCKACGLWDSESI